MDSIEVSLHLKQDMPPTGCRLYGEWGQLAQVALQKQRQQQNQMNQVDMEEKVIPVNQALLAEEEKKLSPLLVFIAGFSVPSIKYDSFAKKFVQLGYRVLTFDMYGRGRTGFPLTGVKCDDVLLIEQLNQLLDALYVTLPANILGHSMGGAFVMRFAHFHLNRVNTIIMACPAGLPVNEPIIAKVMKIPYIGEALFSCARKTLKDGAQKAFYNKELCAEDIEHERALIDEQFEHTQGYGESLLSTLRYFPLNDVTDSYRELAKRPDIPILLIWGDKDEICPFSNSQTAMALVPHIQFFPIAGVGHELCSKEASATYERAVADFLQAKLRK